MKFVICAIALCLFQIASCGVVRRDTTSTVTNTFNDLATEAERTITSLHGKFLDFWGVKNNEELGTLVQTSSNTYAEQLKAIVSQLTEETKKSQGQLQQAARGFETKVNDIITNLQAEHPELNTEQLQQEFENRLRVVVTEAEKFGQVVKDSAPEVQQNFENLTKQIINNTKETAQNLQQTLSNRST